MFILRTCHRWQEYLTIWWIGCITFLASITLALLLHLTVVPGLERLQMQSSLVSPNLSSLFLPLSLQMCFSLLFIASLSAIVSLCHARQAPSSFFFLGSLPLLLVFLLYAALQSMLDLHWTTGIEWESLRALLFAPHLLLVISYFFFVLSTTILLRKRWIEQRVSAAEQNRRRQGADA